MVPLQALQEFIERQRILMQSGLESWRPGIAPWFGGQLVTAGVDEGNGAHVTDVYGRRTAVDESGLPLTPVEGPDTPTQSIIAGSPDVDWGARLEEYGGKAWDALQGLLSSDWFVETEDGMNPSEALSGYLNVLEGQGGGEQKGMNEDDWAQIEAEAALLQAQEDARQECAKSLGVSACEGEALNPDDPSDYNEWRDQQAEDNRYHYTELMGYFSKEEYDRLIEAGFNPQQVVNSRKSMNVALRAINARMGDAAIDEIEKAFGIDREAADQLRADLVQLGADPDKADELARATQALRVISTLGADHTVSNGGMMNAMNRFIDRWVVRSQAQQLAVSNLDNLTEEQLALIQDANGPALVRALQGTQPTEDDPIYQLLMSHIEGGQP